MQHTTSPSVNEVLCDLGFCQEATNDPSVEFYTLRMVDNAAGFLTVIKKGDRCQVGVAFLGEKAAFVPKFYCSADSLAANLSRL